MRVFLDANVLFSAAFSDGAVRRLVNDMHKASHTVVADRYVIEEALRNLAIHRFEAVPVLHTLTAALTVVPTRQSLADIPPEELRGVHLPEKDIPVLASAMSAGCDILITGDARHFGPLFGRTVGGVTVRSPVDAATVLLE